MFKHEKIKFNREKIMKKLSPIIFEYITNGPYAVSDKLFFSSNCIDGFPIGKNYGGNWIDAEPFKGNVLFIDEQSIVIEESKYVFFILDKSLVEKVPKIGDRIKVIPYYRKEFNGDRLCEIFREATQFMDGMFIRKHGSRNDGVTRIPGTTIKNASLALLISNLQTFKLSDGYRSITDLLVTAGAKNFIVNDANHSSNDLPPFIEFEVKSSKFEGKVKIVYVDTSNSYSVMLNGSKTLMTSNVGIYKIACFFEEHLQDEDWKKPQIQILKKAV